MKPHLEERNKRMREEYQRRRATGQDRWEILEDLAKREHLAEGTAQLICEWSGYGHQNENTLKSKVTRSA